MRRDPLRLLFSAAIASVGTASGCATTVTIQSTPDKADVYVTPLGSGQSKKIGETPMTIGGGDLVDQYGGSGPVAVELRKSGFSTERTLITELSAVDLTLAVELKPVTGLESHEAVNALMDELFEGQRLARAGRYDAALAKLGEVETRAPFVAAVHELKGGVFYLQKRYKDALDSYRKAAQYNPSNAEAVRMRNLLERSEPAGETAPAAAPAAAGGAGP